MKLVVLTDTHGNLPALKAVLRQVRTAGYDLLVHTGDAVAIGPYSRECVHLLHNMPKTKLLMGNHDAWLAHGLTTPNPPWLTAGEAEHHFWLSTAFPPEEKRLIAEWPYQSTINCENIDVTFTHYGLTNNKGDFKPIVTEPSGFDLDNIFQEHDADLLFYGHDHTASDRVGRAHYINPGSIGCYHQALARYVIVEFDNGTYTVDYKIVPYDDLDLVRAFEDRQVPDREMIYKAFYGGRINAETLYQV